MRITFLQPHDQFTGQDRLIDRVRGWLRDEGVSHLRLQIGFAKSGPILRLIDEIRRFRERGGSVEAVFGVDHFVTSRQALELALAEFDHTYITHTPARSTFHPKFYLADGERVAFCVIGSHNLTVGGTETNLEGGICLQLDRPADDAEYGQAIQFWEAILPANCDLTQELDNGLMADLLREGLLCDEAAVPSQGPAAGAIHRAGRFAFRPPRPPSAIPATRFHRRTARRQQRGASRPAAQALAIQVAPHHNGEVFLSKLAVNQNPDFFGFPFTGVTAPKKKKNAGYPQRVPDPVVNITVFDGRGRTTFSRENYNLNTVYYEPKAEIRVTVSPEILAHIPQFSLMVMRKSAAPVDYDIDIYQPGSRLYQDYLASCNQTLPSGGAARARRMGWL